MYDDEKADKQKQRKENRQMIHNNKHKHTHADNIHSQEETIRRTDKATHKDRR